MKKLILVFSVALAGAALAGTVADIPQSRVNAALDAAMKASPALASRIGDAQNAWIAWAQMDCKARLGMPTDRDALLTDPPFAVCMADQMTRRADQLTQYACSINSRLCAR